MKKGFYTVIMSQNIQVERDFFVELFDFQETFSSDWYISLISEGFELALIDSEHETIPEKYSKECQGIIINIEVDNVDEIYSQIIQKDIHLLSDIKDEDYGQRHFMIESPSHIMIDIIQEIAPSEEFIQNYTESRNQ